MNSITYGLFLPLVLSACFAQPPWEKMQYGPFMQSSVTMPWSEDGEELDGITLKGTTVKLEHGVSVCFDSDLLKYPGAWSGNWLKLMGPPFDGTHRPPERSRPAVDGTLIFGSGPLAGASVTSAFNDSRPEPFGPLPAAQAKYRGLYLHGNRVAFSYTVGKCAVLETPRAVKHRDQVMVSRSLHLSPTPHPISLLLCELRNDFGHGIGFDGSPAHANGSLQKLGDLTAGQTGIEGARFEVAMGRRLILFIPASPVERQLKIVLGRAGSEAVAEALATAIEDPRELQEAGEGRYPQIVETVGVRGEDKAGFAVDTLTLPDENPWQAWLKIGAFDFFADGKRAALSTWAGDVWTVDGIDANLGALKWRRFATGLFQPLGLKIVNDQIYVLGRDQITRLHDTNGDGEADFYENFNNELCATPNFHEFTFGLETDPAGNFYFSKGAPLLGTQYYDLISKHNGCLLRVSADGKRLDRFASGLRAPNGIGVGPKGQVTSGDNEGIWTPACRLNWMREGGFYGCHGMSHIEPPPANYDPPLCWLPFAVDNSTGGQVWVPEKSWGPLGGELLHISYGKCALFHVLLQKVDGVMQGGVVKFPMTFSSGIMRGRFNATDQQLYVAGLRGWQTSGGRDGCFQRVRRTEKMLQRLTGVAFGRDRIELRFSCALDKELAEDLGSYTLSQWNYRYSEQYGSSLYSVRDPTKEIGKKGELSGEAIRVLVASLSDNGRRVTLNTEPLQPVMQIAIKVDVESTAGDLMVQDYYGTINRLPK